MWWAQGILQRIHIRTISGWILGFHAQKMGATTPLWRRILQARETFWFKYLQQYDGSHNATTALYQGLVETPVQPSPAFTNYASAVHVWLLGLAWHDCEPLRGLLFYMEPEVERQEAPCAQREGCALLTQSCAGSSSDEWSASSSWIF